MATEMKCTSWLIYARQAIPRASSEVSFVNRDFLWEDKVDV